jgi:hypothetical protein
MKLERRQAIERANAEGVSPTEAPGGRPTGARPVVPAPTRRGR